jgi:transposase
LQAEIQKLKEQVAKNSRNSSKPPSSDGMQKPKPKRLREKGQRQTGGQKGHKGRTLIMVEIPDELRSYPLESCPVCQGDLSTIEVKQLEKRQVFDLPPPRIWVVEHQAEVKVCPCCRVQVKARFPESVPATVQYGERFQAQIAYLSSYQLLPVARIAELMGDFYGQSPSEEMILGVLAQLSESVEASLEAIRAGLIQSEVLHADETGLRVDGKLHWLHNLSSEFLTYYEVQEKRGQEALRAIGLIPQFTGYVVHDAYASYFIFEQCQHALCNAHLLRELTFLFEEQDQTWAGELKTLLLTMKNSVEQAQEAQALPPEQLQAFTRSYVQLLERGRQANPLPDKPLLPKRGRIKHSLAQNLLTRLEKHRDAVLAFLYDFRVPFDNNLAERDLRMMKVKQKISGAFRTLKGAETFARVRSYLSTVRKQSGDVLDALTSALLGYPFIPSPL